MKKNLLIFLGALLLIVLGISVFQYTRAYNSELTIENKSNAIAFAEIAVCKERFNLTMGPSKSKTIKFKATCDSDYLISVRLATGKEMAGKFGYVTHGMAFNDRIIVDSNSMKFERNAVN